MAIQPIDLQTLFTQVDKVGKAQSAQKEGLALQQTMQGVQMERKAEARIQSISEAQDSGDGAEKVNDKGERNNAAAQGGGKRQGKDDDAQNENEQEQPVIRDLRLGRNIDISL